MSQYVAKFCRFFLVQGKWSSRTNATSSFSPMKFVTVESGRHQTFGKGSPLMAVLAEAGSAVHVDQGVAAMICPVLGDSTLTRDGYDCELNRGDIGATDSLFSTTLEVSSRGLCVMLLGGV